MTKTAAQAQSDDLTDDSLLGQRVVMRQPRNGYRAAIDPVLLAAAADPKRGATVVDAGIGAGAASLCLLHRRNDIRVIGIEIDQQTCQLAQANAEANGVAARLTLRCGSLRTVVDAMRREAVTVDGVITNPPFLTANQAEDSPLRGRQRSNVESVPLVDWIGACAGLLQRKGTITVIHRADRLDDTIVALHKASCGEVTILPLWPRAGEQARRVIVRARRGIASPARLLPGLVLHGADGQFTPEAERILRDGAGLSLKNSTSAEDSAS